MAKKYTFHARSKITQEQRASLTWLRKQIAAGKVTRPEVELSTGLSNSNVWNIVAGRRELNSKGVRTVVTYADTLRYGKPQPAPDPFIQLRAVAKAATGRQREALEQIVTALLQMYPRRRRPYGIKRKGRA